MSIGRIGTALRCGLAAAALGVLAAGYAGALPGTGAEGGAPASGAGRVSVRLVASETVSRDATFYRVLAVRTQGGRAGVRPGERLLSWRFGKRDRVAPVQVFELPGLGPGDYELTITAIRKRGQALSSLGHCRTAVTVRPGLATTSSAPPIL